MRKETRRYLVDGSPEKIMRNSKILTLLIGVLLFFVFTVVTYAVTIDPIPGAPMPYPRIEPLLNINGALQGIRYHTQSTGAVTGIRYRTTNIYVTVSNYNGTTSTLCVPANFPSPPSGESWLYEVTIFRQDLLDAGADPLALNDLSRISIGADLEVYNQATGAVYRTINNASISTVYPQIEQLGPDFGFSQEHIYDMKSRYVNTLLDIYYAEDGECSFDDGVILHINEQKSGSWSFSYYDWVDNGWWEDHGWWEDDSWQDEDGNWHGSSYWVSNWVWIENWECEPVSVESGDYHELLEMEISEPDPDVVRAGMGTTITVTTRYRNNDPSAWNGTNYTTGVDEVLIRGPLTDNWPLVEYTGTLAEPDPQMVLLDTQIAEYVDYRPGSHSRGCIGGTFDYGYNVPVVEQTWLIPYARFEETFDSAQNKWVSSWTRHQTPPVLDYQYTFGGHNRWYFGFKVPEGETFPLRFVAKGGSDGNLVTCGVKYVTIHEESAYDQIIVRTVDPRWPFPGGVPANWIGKEHLITDLEGWYFEREEAEERNFLEELSNNFRDGLRRLQGKE